MMPGTLGVIWSVIGQLRRPKIEDRRPKLASLQAGVGARVLGLGSIARELAPPLPQRAWRAIPDPRSRPTRRCYRVVQSPPVGPAVWHGQPPQRESPDSRRLR